MFRSETPILRFRGPMGVPVEISGSIIFLALIFVGVGSASQVSPLHGVILFAMVVLAIFCHEFGHAWGARSQGIAVVKVVIHGGGGYCQHASAGRRESEFLVAMGPVVNLALWALSGLLGHWLISGIDFEALALASPPAEVMAALTWRFEAYAYVSLFAQINLILFVLNLVPVQPLDGGKLLHLGLLRVLSAHSALRVAGAIGLIFAVLWVPAMLLLYFTFGWMLLFFPAILVHWQMAKGEVPQ